MHHTDISPAGQLSQLTQQYILDTYQINIPASQVSVSPTPKGQTGDYTILTFTLSKIVKKSPDAVAQELGAYLQSKLADIKQVEVIKGFLNVTLSDAYWQKQLEHIAAIKHYGMLPPTGRIVSVEYCSPNTNKPLHLGHLRNIFLGYSVAEILKAAGNTVIKTSIVNDRGIHICKSMLAYLDYGHGETPQSSGLKGDHLVGKYYVLYETTLRQQIATLVAEGLTEETAKKEAPYTKVVQQMLLDWENNVPEVRALWKTMNTWVLEGFEETYKKIGNDFDKHFFESDTYLLGKTIVEDGLQKGVFYKKEDGSVWIDLTSDGLDEKLVLRADGTSVYITQDMGTADLRYDEWHPDTMIYVVGNEQDYHFKVLQLICKRLHKAYADGIYHLSYGMVDLPHGRMKSREGTVVDADDLIAEMDNEAEKHTVALGKTEGIPEAELVKLYHILGMGALKYFILKVDPKKRMIFNPEESIDFHGHTGPFIQYTYARIQSVLRKFVQMFQEAKTYTYTNMHPAEHALCVHLANYPDTVNEAAIKYDPGMIANYVYTLVKQFNQVYAEVSFLNDNDENAVYFRQRLAMQTSKVIHHSMHLLGIDVPDRM